MNNSFEWQVGNTTRFIKFADITKVDSKSSKEAFFVHCNKTMQIVPINELERFNQEHADWMIQQFKKEWNSGYSAKPSIPK